MAENEPQTVWVVTESVSTAEAKHIGDVRIVASVHPTLNAALDSVAASRHVWIDEARIGEPREGRLLAPQRVSGPAGQSAIVRYLCSCEPGTLEHDSGPMN